MSGGAECTVYRGARLLDPASGLDEIGDLVTEGGTIAGLGPGLFADGVPEGMATIDCRGLSLSPGLIDMQARLCEPGAEHLETLASAGEAAAAGGITTLVATPDTLPVVDEVALVEFVARRARETSLVRVLPMAAATKGRGGAEMTEMGLLAAAGAIAFGDGDRAIADARVMRRVLAYASTFGLLVVQAAEEPSLADGGLMNEGEIAMRLGLAGIPNAAETIQVERDLRLVELTGSRWHAAHLSTAEAISALACGKDKGLAVSAGAAPANFALNETAVGDYRTFAKVKPPLRAEADRAAVVEGLRAGIIDVISSGHAPQDADSKRLPFAQAAFGIVGLETMLALALELWHNGSLGLLDVLRAMTSRPAEILGLPQGRLRKGAPADLVLLDLDVPWRIDERRFRSKCHNSPFDGRPVQGRAVRTVVAGATVFQHAGEG